MLGVVRALMWPSVQTSNYEMTAKSSLASALLALTPDRVVKDLEDEVGENAENEESQPRQSSGKSITVSRAEARREGEERLRKKPSFVTEGTSADSRVESVGTQQTSNSKLVRPANKSETLKYLADVEEKFDVVSRWQSERTKARLRVNQLAETRSRADSMKRSHNPAKREQKFDAVRIRISLKTKSTNDDLRTDLAEAKSKASSEPVESENQARIKKLDKQKFDAVSRWKTKSTKDYSRTDWAEINSRTDFKSIGLKNKSDNMYPTEVEQKFDAMSKWKVEGRKARSKVDSTASQSKASSKLVGSSANKSETKPRAEVMEKIEVVSSWKKDRSVASTDSQSKASSKLVGSSANKSETKRRAEVMEKIEAVSSWETECTEDNLGVDTKVESKERISKHVISDVDAILSDRAINRLELCAPRLAYYRLMVPNWLRRNATWSCEYHGNDLGLDIKSDASNWENIFRVQVMPPQWFTDWDDVTVKMIIGVELPVKASALKSNMSYMISDGLFAMGFQLNDPLLDYIERGPYQPVEGGVGSKCLLNPNTNLAATVTTTSKSNPNQFEMRFKPGEAWACAYCTLDEGHKVLAQYSTPLKLGNGLRFEVYRRSKEETYRINYVEVSVYLDSPAVPLAVLKSKRYTYC